MLAGPIEKSPGMIDPVLVQHYAGHYLEQPIGNNAFSFADRKNQRIYVPPLIEGTPADLCVGSEIAFSEVVEDREVNAPGLRNFIHWRRSDQDIFFFDNHNHAFFFWCWGVKTGRFPAGLPLVHVDQHKDTRLPSAALSASGWREIAFDEAFCFTNNVLNVGNFIPPALNLGIFSEVHQVEREEDFLRDFENNFVLDIDLDIFSPELDYIPYELKIRRLKEWGGRACFVTVATSPFFMDQASAIRITRDIFF